MRSQPDYVVWIGCGAIFVSVLLPVFRRAVKAFPDTPLWVIVPATLVVTVLVSIVVLAAMVLTTTGLRLLVERLRRK